MKRRRFLYGLGFLLLFMIAGQVLSQEFPFNDGERLVLSQSVVVVRNSQDSQGSGVLVSTSGVIWTNAHVVEDDDDQVVDIWIYGGENRPPLLTYRAEVTESSRTLDFAQLQITADHNGNAVTPASLNLNAISHTSSDVSQGDSVFLFGYPLIAEGVLNISPGIITAIPSRAYGIVYKSDAEFAPGASGALVVNVNGEMIGIASADRADTSGRLLDVIPVATICSNLPLVCQAQALEFPTMVNEPELLYVSRRNGSDGIFSMNVDGTNVFQFSGLPENSSYPQWSPVLGRILFHSNYYIYSVNWDGTGLVRLTDTGLDEYGAWSPNGSQIAFHSWRDGELEIYVMNSDGSNVSQLTFNDVDDGFPKWSPDGRRIVFQRNANAERGNADIFIIDSDGTNEQRITNDNVWDWVPKWSPDGNQIVFMSFDGQDWEINTIGTNGRNRSQLTYNTVDDFDPVWSPDGNHIAFTRGRWNSTNDEGNEIAVMNADGSDVRILTNDNFVDGQPSWR